MTNIRKILYFAVLIISSVAFSQSQPPVEIKRSTEKVIFNGKVYFVHVVKKSETMYSIAKAYNVTQNDIVLTNPTAASGIKVDQVLKIPEAAISTGEVVLKNSPDFSYYIVEQGQTLYSIAQKYGLKVEDLQKINPELEVSSIQLNQVIKIPIKKESPLINNTVITPPAMQMQTISYQVKDEETLYSISKKFNVTVDQIKQVNTDIVGENIKLGQQIYIPLVVFAKSDTTHHSTPSLSCYNKLFCDSITSSNVKKSIKVSLLLPFYSSGGSTDSLGDGLEQNIEMLEERNAEVSAVSSCFLEFYEGALLAIKKLKDEGVSVILNTYDTEKGTSYLLALSAKPEFQQSDLIIGPALSPELSVIQPICKEKQIPIISPINQKSEYIKDNPYFFQANPSNNKCFELMMKYIAGFEKENIIIVLSGHENNPQIALQADIIKGYFSDPSIVKIFSFIKDSCDILPLLDPSRRNLIVVPSKDEVFSSNLLSYLNAFYLQNKIEVFGNSSWLKFSSIDLEYLHNLEFTYFTPFFIDYSKASTKMFLMDFRKQYGFEPDRQSSHGFNYAMLGYDLTYQFLKAYNNYGKSFGCCLDSATDIGLLGDYNFVRPSIIDGFQNESGAIIKYNKNFEIKKVMDIK